jgi:hypothetical protein
MKAKYNYLEKNYELCLLTTSANSCQNNINKYHQFNILRNKTQLIIFQRLLSVNGLFLLRICGLNYFESKALTLLFIQKRDKFIFCAYRFYGLSKSTRKNFFPFGVINSRVYYMVYTFPTRISP